MNVFTLTTLMMLSKNASNDEKYCSLLRVADLRGVREPIHQRISFDEILSREENELTAMMDPLNISRPGL